jgi:RNA polymerase sigma factor (sigma-70 family)
MGKIFLVWKDKHCKGINPEWITMTGKEFGDFQSKEENQGRFFITLPAQCNNDNTIIMETTAEEYEEYETERKHSAYLKSEMMKHETISAYTFEDEDNDNLYDKTSSDDELIDDTVTRLIMNDTLHNAIKNLSLEEQEIIKLYYFTDGATERSVAEKLGLHYMTLRNKKIKILKKIKNFLVQN